MRFLTSFACLVAIATWLPAAEPARKPNIVVILADDLGYGDITCQGGKVPTPHLDALAKKAMRCTNGYVTAPYCSPSRAALLTGRYQARFGLEVNCCAGQDGGLPLSEKTLAERLKKRGYATAVIGKWHLGEGKEYMPLQRGFDEFVGFYPARSTYLQARILRNREQVVEKEYLTEAFAREAVDFIDRHARAPFFLYLPFNAVHNPLEASRKYLDRFPDIKDRDQRTYAAMISALDDGVGEVMGKIEREKLAGDTLVFFLSDNGGVEKLASNDPLRGGKGTLWEGGIRVPFLVSWPGVIPEGKDYQLPVSALDVVPTALNAAGVECRAEDGLDGVDLVPYLQGKNDRAPHEWLYWRYGRQAAVRQGQWKIVLNDKNEPQLFGLDADPGEATDLADKKPEVVKQLRTAWEKWTAQMAEARK